MRMFLSSVFIVLMGCSSPVYADYSGDLQSEISWIELEKVQEVERLIKIKDYDRASILYDILLEEYPDSQSLKALGEVLRGVSGVKGPVLVKQSSSTLLDDWIKYKSYRASGDLAYAWKFIKSIEQHCKETTAKPVFYSSYVKELSGLEKEISQLLTERISSFGDKLDAIRNYRSTYSKLDDLIEIYLENIELLRMYEELPVLLEYKSKIKNQIEVAARIEFSKVKLMKELNGCSSALGEYLKLEEMLKVSDLPFYNEIRHEIEICQKK